MTVATIFILGFLFGAILKYAKLNRYDTISGTALLENFTVPKTIALAIGIGAVLINIETALGLSSYHIKPFMVGGIILGGLIFGVGMGILGYCPGTLAISAGEGSIDAGIGILGGLLGGLSYTLALPLIAPALGPNLGALSLNTLLGTNALFFAVLIGTGAAFIGIAFLLDKLDHGTDRKWIYAGIALALLNSVVFLGSLTNRPIGASTAFPYLGDLLAGAVNNDYFNKIKTPGNWEVIFLLGSFAAGLILSLIKREFKFTLIHNTWRKRKGSAPSLRAFWAFIGGFILIFGARMAGGCTSGHILSGGMQLALSSLTFAVFVFIGLLVTGRLFFKKAD